MAKARIITLGTDTDIEAVKENDVTLLEDYEYGETLNAIYRRLKGKELEDKYIMSGPDTLGKNVHIKVAEVFLVALILISLGYDIEFVGHSRAAIQIKMASHSVQKVIKFSQAQDMTEADALEKIIAMILTVSKDASPFECFVARGLAEYGAHADPVQKNIIKFAGKELNVEKLCSVIKNPGKAVEGAWFLKDPVAGQEGRSNWIFDEFFEIPDFIKKAVYKYQRHERSPFFEPPLPKRYHKDCKLSIDSSPGHHGTPSGGLYEQSVKASIIIKRDAKGRLRTRHAQKLMTTQIIDFIGDDAFDISKTFQFLNAKKNKTIDHVILKYLKMSLKARIAYKLKLYSKIIAEYSQYEEFENTAYTGLNALSKMGFAGVLGLSTKDRRLVLVGKDASGAVTQAFEDIHVLRKPPFPGFVNKDHIQLWIAHNSGNLQGALNTAFPVVRFNYLADCFENPGKCDLVKVDSFAGDLEAVDALDTSHSNVYVRSNEKYDLVLVAVESGVKVEEIELEKISKVNDGMPILFRKSGNYSVYGMKENGEWGVTHLSGKLFASLNPKFEALLGADDKSEILPFANITKDMQMLISTAHTSEHLFHVNKISKECTRIKLPRYKIEQFDKDLPCSDKARSLMAEEIKKANTICGSQFQLPDIAANSCYDYNQIKSMCGLFYYVIDEHVAHIVSVFTDVSTHIDGETINQFTELMNAKNRLFKAIDSYAGSTKSSKHTDLYHELTQTWDRIAKQSYEQLINSANVQFVKLLDASKDEKLTDQERIQLCLSTNENLLQKSERLKEIAKTGFLSEQEIKQIEHRIEQALVYSHQSLREILNKKVLAAREKMDSFFGDNESAPLILRSDAHEALVTSLKTMQEEVSNKDDRETYVAMRDLAKKKLKLIPNVLSEYRIKAIHFKQQVEDKAKAVEQELTAILAVKDLFQGYDSDLASSGLVTEFAAAINKQAARLKEKETILAKADLAYKGHETTLTQLQNALFLMAHNCRRHLLQFKAVELNSQVDSLINEKSDKSLAISITKNHEELHADCKRLNFALREIIPADGYENICNQIGVVRVIAAEAESLVNVPVTEKFAYKGISDRAIQAVQAAYSRMVAQITVFAIEPNEKTPQYQINFFNHVKNLIEKLRQQEQIAIENIRRVLGDRLRELDLLQDEINNNILYRCQKTIDNLALKQNSYEVQMARLLNNVYECERDPLFNPCKEINIYYMQHIAKESDKALRQHPEDKAKLSHTLELVNQFVERKNNKFNLKAIFQEGAGYVNDSRPYFQRLGYSMIALGVLSVAGLAAITFLTGGANLIPMMIAGGVLLSAESGLGTYSIFQSRAPKIKRLLDNFAVETVARIKVG